MRRIAKFLAAAITFVSVSGAAAFADFSVVSFNPDGMDVKINTENPAMRAIKIGQTDAFELFVPETSPTFNKDCPEVPQMSKFFMLPSEKDPEIVITGKKVETITLKGVLKPSKGSLSRDVNPDDIPFTFGKVYNKDEWYPSDQELLKAGKPFIFRDVRGSRVTFHPVQFNPVKKQLRFYRELTFKVIYSDKTVVNPKKSRSVISKTYEPIYRKYFLNFQDASKRLPRLNENGRLVIVSADDLYDATLPLVVWKKKCGMDAAIYKLSDILNTYSEPLTASGTVSDGIKAKAVQTFLNAEFQQKNFTHVILVGDAPQIPTLKGANQGADSDPCYVKLIGDDNVPDAIISRISATNSEEVAYQVAKFINYERFPSENGDDEWYQKTMGIAGPDGNSPTDYERCDLLRAALLNSRFSSVDQIYKYKSSSGSSSGGGGISGPFGPFGPFSPFGSLPMFTMTADRPNAEPEIASAASVASEPAKPVLSDEELKEQVRKYVNEGRSLINYIGHGSTTSWVTSGFDTSYCQYLANGWKLPIILSVACVNGNFVKGADCFAEAWMKTGTIENPRGAVGFYGATTNQDWVPPCDVQTEISSSLIVNETWKTVGALVTNGIIKGLEQHGVETKSPGVKMAEQWHWFGDCTTQLRTRAPKKITADINVAHVQQQSQIEISVKGEEGLTLSGLQVTIYSTNMEKVITGKTDDNGKVVFAAGIDENTDGYFTIMSPTIVPIVDQPFKF
ncbi:MAG: hypothetical protein HQM10_25185 [Candidatus Riflebacteria bacterium]|nr:hypothetical protein [Candidatus Riflebacteria bacterium]